MGDNHSIWYLVDELDISYPMGIVTSTRIRHPAIPTPGSGSSIFPAFPVQVEAAKESVNSVQVFHLCQYSTREISDAA